MTKNPILQVAINAPLSRLFDYLPPAAADAALPRPGCRVLVPFGRQRQIGTVISHATHSELPLNKLRRVLSTIDIEPVLRDQDLWLIRFTSDYYHHPLGEVVAAALPVLLRQGKPLNPVIQRLAITGGQRIYDRWLACWTEEEIAKEEGMPRTTVETLLKELTKMANLPKPSKVLADFADPDFQVPLYNIWKQQTTAVRFLLGKASLL